MHRRHTMVRSWLLGVTLGLLVCSPAAAQFQPWEGSSVLTDPEWRARFLGSYGFLSGAEPEIRTQELELLREVIELMRVNPQAAATMLSTQMTPESSAALDFILANLYFQNGQLGEAAESYAKALEKFPDFRRAHKNVGLLSVQLSDFDRALEHLTRAVELGDRDGRSYGLIGYAYINRENYVAAEQAYRNAILLQPDTRDWKLGLARSLLAMQKNEEAVALFGRLIEEDPTDATAWLLQANAYVGLERPRDAAVNLETVRMLGEAKTSTLVLLGDIYMNEGMYEFAAEAYLELVRGDAGATEFRNAYRAADLLIRTQAYGEAQRMLDVIDERYAGKIGQEQELQVLTLQAKVARAVGREEDAAKLLESIVERDGTRGEALLELARYYKDKKQIERALLLIERAEKLEDYRYRALLDHAQLRVSQREYREAAELLERALKIKREPRVERFLARVQQAVRPL